MISSESHHCRVVLISNVDRHVLPLGPVLDSQSPVWKRPQEVWTTGELALASPALLPQSIRQNVVTDCSVCTAVAICLHHHRKFASKVRL